MGDACTSQEPQKLVKAGRTLPWSLWREAQNQERMTLLGFRTLGCGLEAQGPCGGSDRTADGGGGSQAPSPPGRS